MSVKHEKGAGNKKKEGRKNVKRLRKNEKGWYISKKSMECEKCQNSLKNYWKSKNSKKRKKHRRNTNEVKEVGKSQKVKNTKNYHCVIAK